MRDVLREPAVARRTADQLLHDPALAWTPAGTGSDDDRRPVRDAVEKGNRPSRQRAPEALEEPRRRSRHEPPAGRALHRGHEERTDCGGRSPQAQDSGDWRRGYE